MHGITLMLAGIGLLTIFCQWAAWWIKLPAILFLLLAGILIGPVFGLIHPDALFGQLLQPMISLSVALILFEGSLTLNFDQVRSQIPVIRNLVTLGLVISAVLTTELSHWLLGLSWEIAALLGAITAVTGPTVITPILRTVRPNAKISNILRWEGTLIDPIGALLALLIFGFVMTAQGHETIHHILFKFSQEIAIGLLMGVVFGYWLGIAIRRHWFPDFLHNVATLTIVLGVFTLSNRVDEGSGLLAVTIMGVWLANMKGVPVDEILGFKESLSILLISGLFILLAARIPIAHIADIAGSACVLFLAVQFVVRPISIAACTYGSDLTWRERCLLAWIAPRGIVAAAVAAVFAMRLRINQVPDANLLVLLTFLVIIGTVFFQGITSRWVASLLKVSEPEPKGFLIIGANIVARSIANALEKHGFRTLLAGLNWDSSRVARMENLKTYFGNPVSEHADRHLDLVGIGRLLALSPQDDINALSCMRYRSEFGRKNVFALPTQPKTRTSTLDKYAVASHHKGNTLFGDGLHFQFLKEMFEAGAAVHSTLLTESFDYKSYRQCHQNRAIPLFAINPKGQLHVFSTEHSPHPSTGWTLLSLIPKEENNL